MEKRNQKPTQIPYTPFVYPQMVRMSYLVLDWKSQKLALVIHGSRSNSLGPEDNYEFWY